MNMNLSSYRANADHQVESYSHLPPSDVRPKRCETRFLCALSLFILSFAVSSLVLRTKKSSPSPFTHTRRVAFTKRNTPPAVYPPRVPLPPVFSIPRARSACSSGATHVVCLDGGTRVSFAKYSFFKPRILRDFKFLQASVKK